MASTESVVFLRNSERSAWNQCRQMWFWSYVDTIKPNSAAAPLRFGDLVHRALAEWYIPGRKRGIHPARTFEGLLRAQQEELGEDFEWGYEDDKVSAMDLGLAMLRRYVNHYGPDEDIEVLVPEMPFQVPAIDLNGRPVYVKDRQGRRSRLVHVGTGDAVIRRVSTNQLGILEHKTAKAISTRHLNMDDQAGTYWLFIPMFLQQKGLLKPGQDLSFVEYNFLRKALDDTRDQNERGEYLNKNGTVSKNQPAPYFQRFKVWRGPRDREALLRRVNAVAQEMSMVRTGKLPVYKQPSSAYPDQHCSSCAYREMCELHETGTDWKAYARQTMTKWDPYEDHRY